ncbi:Sugar phosphate permease [Leifsonia sp. 98AMF]|jgi:MFS family permease|uniref:MFS transporter n=1 Tax=unclassified Leifsonia TaxID=2663824 RepID=UPI00087CF85F|nr:MULTISPECIES: MFS transporter [unclassified Leifsonia]SDH29873.1 Sugar phosphate permease [Leifsonia sp. 197AMF]SDJ07081.1 Sugar phosphate permease [Leifsonia sp. 466MF]SDJ64388.1 Sugar phosphate permease [Leifsonia sp. 157MF]SDN27919.1 Sugar phosphate permease [Leifsonia sp. 509MF]SEM93063.1 Sugar phosphate permease [Leifsonia sp. 467MF]
MFARTVRRPRPWLMLAFGVLAQASSTVFVSTPAFLIPLLHTERGLSLAQAGLLASAPTLGLVLTLIAWGALSDRIGERWVIASGLALTALAAVAAMFVDSYVALGALFLVGGMASASPNAASGRVVIGWFPKERRGLAMGIRQMCQPLGVAIAAVSVPLLAANGGIAAALIVPAVLCGVSAVLCAIGIVDPPRPPRKAAEGEDAHPQAVWRPYRETSLLWRIHAVSMLLVVPQFTVSTFGLVWLVSQLHFSSLAAGIVIGVSQFAGAIGRIGVGVLSDRVGSHLRPLRWVSVCAVAVMLLMAAASALGSVAAAVILIVAAIVTVADNGLAYTSVAEIAGPFWSGRALGAQNTGQFLAASVVGPAVGALIGWVGYPVAFAVVALCPAVATPLVPRDRELAVVPA